MNRTLVKMRGSQVRNSRIILSRQRNFSLQVLFCSVVTGAALEYVMRTNADFVLKTKLEMMDRYWLNEGTGVACRIQSWKQSWGP